MSKPKVLILLGESGSGKSTIATLLAGSYPDIFYMPTMITTRPPRENEENGIDYYFMNEMPTGAVLRATFKDWEYGLDPRFLAGDRINIICVSPLVATDEWLQNNTKMRTVYIAVGEKDRLIRQLFRETNPDIDEIIRRLYADREDFSDINPDMVIHNDKAIKKKKVKRWAKDIKALF